VINDVDFGRSSSYEDLIERGSAENDIEHVNNILGVVQRISGIVHDESDRSEMISKICDYLLETPGHLDARIFADDDNTIGFRDSSSQELGRVDGFSRNTQLPFPAILAFQSDSPLLTSSSDEECSECTESANCKGRSCISIRLETTEERTYGVLHVSGLQRFTSNIKEELQLLTWIASRIAHGFEKLKGKSSIRQLSWNS